MGDAPSQLGQIYDTHAPRIFRYIYHRLGDRALAEDLTSEVFVRFLHVRSEPENLAAYLYRIAHNVIVDYLRRNPPVEPLSDTVQSNLADPLEQAAIELERARLRRALSRLTPEQSQVLVLRFLEGLSIEEVGRVLGRSAGAVKALQRRGLATLRDLLGTRDERAG